MNVFEEFFKIVKDIDSRQLEYAIVGGVAEFVSQRRKT